MEKQRNVSCTRLETLSRRKDDKRIPAWLHNVRKNRRRLKTERNYIAREETFQEALLFSLVRAELRGLHTGSQHHPRCSAVTGASQWDREMGHKTKGELIPTAAAVGDTQDGSTCSGTGTKTPNSQDREENLDTMRKEKQELTPGTLQPYI